MNINDVVTVDFETYFDSQYSLRAKRYNMSGYIRDPLFAVHCASIKEGKKPSKCYRGDALKKKLDSIDWTKKDLLCHNTAFDGAILAWHYDIVPRMYYDTLSMSRALHFELGGKGLDEVSKLYGRGGKLDGGKAIDKVKGVRPEDVPADVLDELMKYCNQDNDECFAIFCEQIKVFPEEELRLIDLTIRMFTQATFLLDVPRCEKALNEAIRERQIGIAVGLHAAQLSDEKDLTSNQRFVSALKKLNVDAPTKISKYNGEVTYALSENDEAFLELLEHEDKRVVRLVQGRLAAKSTIGETRAARLLDAGCNGQTVPVYLNYYGAKTGRWSGGNKLNFQNFPRGSELRKALIAPPGHVVVVSDSAQIEARGVNWLSDNRTVLDVFANNEDVYSYTASGIYGRKIDKEKDPNERFVGKVATLGLGYGMGGRKLQTTLALGTFGPPVDMSLTECEKIVKKFRNANDAIVKLWRAMDGLLARMTRGEEGEYGVLRYDGDGIWLPNGLCIQYPGLKATTDEHDRTTYSYYSKGSRKKLYGGLVTENVVQALAGVIIREQMIEYADWLKTLKLKPKEVARIVTMTHDEIVSIVPERFAKKAMDMKTKIMKTPRSWCPDIPLNAEGGYALEYSK